MKKVLIFLLVLSLTLSLTGCFSHRKDSENPKDHKKPMDAIVIPDNASIGESKTFQKDGIQLTLTEKFTETRSELGFYAYYVADFCGVVVLNEDFSLADGAADLSLEEYIGNVIANNGHKNVEPQCRDGLWYYVKDSGNMRSYSYSFKGSNAFWIVQFVCMTQDAPMLEDLFYLWAECIEVE